MSIDGFPGTELRIWAVGCHRLVANYLSRILATEPGLEVRWFLGPNECSAEKHEPHLFVVDAGETETPVEETIRCLTISYPGAKCIVLGRQVNAAEVYHLLSIGARGFVLYEKVVSSLGLAIHTVHDGGTWIDACVPRRYGRVRDETIKHLAAIAVRDGLTSREIEIVHLVRQRFSNKEISKVLALKVSTIKFHLSHIYLKLQIVSRSDLWRSSASGVASSLLP